MISHNLLQPSIPMMWTRVHGASDAKIYNLMLYTVKVQTDSENLRTMGGTCGWFY